MSHRYYSAASWPLALTLLAIAQSAEASSDVGPAAQQPDGLELNPFECHGRYESATGSRTAAQMRLELQKKLDQLRDTDPAPVRAMKYCVVARLKQRLGDTDTAGWFDKAIEAAPGEPGYELFAGMYWSGARGAGAPVTEQAESHYYQALRKLERLSAEHRVRAYHEIIREWTQKRLLVLYQQDGQQLLPFKAFRQGAVSEYVPRLAVSSQLQLTRDTRDLFFSSEQRTFTGELLFAQSDLRAADQLTLRERWDIARAPLRLQVDTRARLAQSPLGTFDFTHRYHHAEAAQISSFYQPTQRFVDVDITQLGVGYERTVPLYPLFDLRLRGGWERIQRRGIVEFLPEREETFDMLKFAPSFSRFIGTDKLSLDLVWARMDVQDLPGGVPEQGLREKVIRAARLDYAIYSPLLFPILHQFGLYGVRAPTRGLHVSVGVMQDDEIYGIRQVVRQDLYGGLHLQLPAYELGVQSAYLRSRTRWVDPNDNTPAVYTDPHQSYGSVRTNAFAQVRLVNPDATPGIAPTRLGFALDEVNVNFPVQWETSVEGPNDYSSLRGGAELWVKLYQHGTGGTPVLLSGGMDTQYFYNLDGKFVNTARLGVRVGWSDL